MFVWYLYRLGHRTLHAEGVQQLLEDAANTIRSPIHGIVYRVRGHGWDSVQLGRASHHFGDTVNVGSVAAGGKPLSRHATGEHAHATSDVWYTRILCYRHLCVAVQPILV